MTPRRQEIEAGINAVSNVVTDVFKSLSRVSDVEEQLRLLRDQIHNSYDRKVKATLEMGMEQPKQTRRPGNGS